MLEPLNHLRLKRAINSLHIFGALGACLAVSACSHVEVEPISKTADPNREISALEERKERDYARQVNVLSPTYFEKAEKYLEKAKEKRSNNKSNESILEDVAESKAYLLKGEQVADEGEPLLKEVVDARRDAIAANSPVLFSKEFENAEKNLKTVTNDLENGKKQEAEKKRNQLKTQYLDLEIHSIKKASLDPSREVLERARKEGANEQAPKTLAEAERAIEQADSAITIDRHNQQKIQQHSRNAYNLASRALKMTRDSKAVDKKNSEDLLLQLEAQNSRATDLEKASQASLGLIALKSKIDYARSLFSPEEAEVLQDGQKLLIRLKALNFPFGKDYIATENYGLLTKVQSVIQEMNAQKVVIEGHTDSIGSNLANKKVSEKRAAAVKQYLEANSGNEGPKIHSVGYGYSKPIAPNNTEKGRAQNRRVDIIVEPGERDLLTSQK